MILRYFILMLITLQLLLCSCSNRSNYGVVTSEEDVLLRKKIGTMMIVGVGFNGCNYNLNESDKRIISDLNVGGVILLEKWPRLKRGDAFRGNMAKYIANIKDFASRKIFVSVDQEGGSIMRLRTSDGFSSLPSAYKLGQINNRDTTIFYVDVLTSDLKNMGFNMNYAPCLDVNVNPDSPIVGAIKRSFSDDPHKVADMAELFFEGQRANGIVSVYKHFPGHGSSEVDSHKGFTDVTNTWQQKEITPYQILISRSKCDVVMCSHVFNANLDKAYPSSLSKSIVTGLLREQIGFDGVVITDDMCMGAIRKNWKLEEVIPLSINAGVDMFIFGRGGFRKYKKAVDIVFDLVKSGEIPESRIEESYQRIVRLQKLI